MTDAPTVAQLISRSVTLPSDAVERPSLLGRLFGGESRDVRQNARVLLETLYLQPGFDAVSGYRRSETRVAYRSVNGLMTVTLSSPGLPAIVVQPGAVASDPWTLARPDGRSERIAVNEVAAAMRTIGRRLDQHGRRRMDPVVVMETWDDAEIAEILREPMVMLGAACAISTTLVNYAVTSADLLRSGVVGIVAGLLIMGAAWLGLAWLMRSRRNEALRDPVVTPPTDACWDELRKAYDDHGIEIERLRMRADDALRTMAVDADPRSAELVALLDNTLERLRSSYATALSFGGSAAIASDVRSVLAEVVGEMEAHAEARRQSIRDDIAITAAHVRGIVMDKAGTLED